MIKHLRNMALVLVASIGILFMATSAKAENVGPVIGALNTAELATIAMPATAYVSMGAIFVTMVGGCELIYKTTGNTCGHPAPITEPGYNQAHGIDSNGQPLKH